MTITGHPPIASDQEDGLSEEPRAIVQTLAARSTGPED